MQAAIQGNTVAKEQFRIIESREYGASFACLEMMKQLGLPQAIYSRTHEEWVRASMAMIAGRVVFAGSKLALSYCAEHSALWDLCGFDGKIHVNTCYAAMDKLYARQKPIQRYLAKKHLQNGIVILYDITSCYMEGEYEDSDLVDFGYNRDKKRGHEQIVITLLCTKEGCPVAVDVLRGNTKDETTVLDKVEELRKIYGLESIIFVGDRGMVTQANFKQLDHERVKVISALTHAQLKSLCDKGIIELNQFDENRIVEVIDGGLRYCLCKNPKVAKDEASTRQALLKKTIDAFDKIIASTKKCKYNKSVRIGNVLEKYKIGKYFLLTGDGDDIKYAINETKINQEASFDGCYIIYTDVHVDDMTAIEAVENYKSLQNVEQAFRAMTTVHLEMRPIFHKTDDRIRCHVFICMLAYYILWHMKQRLRSLMDADGKGANRKFTFAYCMNSLKSVRKETVDFSGTHASVITVKTAEQSKIMKELRV